MLWRCLAALGPRFVRPVSKRAFAYLTPESGIFISNLQRYPHIVISRGLFRREEPQFLEHAARPL
jgi:hypothetical protein